MIKEQNILLYKFYCHEIDILNDIESCRELMALFLTTTTRDVLDILLHDFHSWQIQCSDIPQYSNFDVAILRVPQILAVKEDGVDFVQMGFMLDSAMKKTEANMKYGENHAKTASLLALSSIVNSKVYPSLLAKEWNVLSDKQKKVVLPKLCLYCKLFQNYYALGANEEILIKLMSCLSESTLKRRKSNCIQIISKIDTALTNEF